MAQGNIIGYEINEKTCQISFYNERQMEPETLEVDADNYQIPLIIGKLRDTWAYGKEARRLVSIKEGYTATRLLSRSIAGEKVELGEETYDAVWLLSQFIEMSLQSFPQIDGIVFTVPALTEELAHLLRGIAVRMKIDKRHIFIQDYKESFCNYLFYQPKELWQYDAALFCCDRNEIKAYMLRRLKPGLGGGKTTFVTVDEVASAHMKELAMVYPVLNEDKAKEADAIFSRFIESVFDKRIVSSVFLTGEGFENNWYPRSLRVLCNGRRAFIGNNLYSKGACYTAYRKLYMHIENPVYLSEDKLTDQITVNMRVDGQEMWYPIVSWGTHWYESNNQWEVLMEDVEDIEFHVESLIQGTMRTEKISMDKFPKRAEYSMRLQMETLFLDEKTYSFSIKEDGKTVVVENEAGKGFVNQAQTGGIRIEKASDDGVLKGFTFRVEGADITGNAFSKDFVTDEKGQIHIEGLRIGDYVISEVSNKANEKYELPANVTVTVHEGKTVVAKFHNKLKPVTDIPKTGDTTNMPLWAALAGISAVGACAAAFFTFRKKKEVGKHER